jgi:hypothetical protein
MITPQLRLSSTLVAQAVLSNHRKDETQPHLILTSQTLIEYPLCADNFLKGAHSLVGMTEQRVSKCHHRSREEDHLSFLLEKKTIWEGFFEQATKKPHNFEE